MRMRRSFKTKNFLNINSHRENIIFILIASHNRILDVTYCNVGYLVKSFSLREGHGRVLNKSLSSRYKFCVAVTFKARNSLWQLVAHPPVPDTSSVPDIRVSSCN